MSVARIFLLSHRYLGMGLSLIFVLWFASGFVIIYTGGMPALTSAERLLHLPDLDLTQVSITPRQAQQLSNSETLPKLMTVMGRPAYQFAGRRYTTVFADDGSLLSRDMVSSRQLVAAFTGADDLAIERMGRVEEVDQWTLGLRGLLPLEKFRVHDSQGSELYVSPTRGQVVLSTNSVDRALAWLGAIPHWLYFVELRKRTALWSDTVIWLASLGSMLALLGLILVFTQLRRVRPFRFREAIPYRGLMRWHYILGLLFGLITLTWVFSGLLSMEPYAWNSARGLALSGTELQGGTIDLQEFAALAGGHGQLNRGANNAAIKEIEFKRLQGNYYYQLTVSAETSHWGFERRLLRAIDFQPAASLFSTDYVTAQLQLAVTDYQLIATDVLTEYDNYYYSRPSADGPGAPLPALRVKYDDPAQTWFYVDLNTSELVYQSHRWGRVERWLYHGLHSLDFGFFYGSRPLWDIVVIVLLTGGLLLCGLGCYLGFKRLARNTKQLF